MGITTNLQYFAKGGGCFLAGTQIGTPDGDRPIEDLMPGDKVISFNEETGQTEESVIGDIDSFERDEYYVINGIIKATAEHPFYTDRGIVEVKDLKPTYKLVGRYDKEIPIYTYVKVEETVTVYNLLNVAPNHNYYASNLLVHNKGGGGCFLAGTKVTTPFGQKAIETLKVGDIVTSNNDSTFIDENSTVAKIDVLQVKGYYILNDNLKVTATHPMYVTEDGHRWVKHVSDLVVGDNLVTDAGWQTLRKIEYIDKEVTVYNLIDVSPNHNYYANFFLVHNKGGGGGRGGGGGGRSSSSHSSSSKSSSKSSSISAAKPRVGTSTAKPGSKIKTADGKEVQSSAKAPSNKKFTSSKGVVGDNGYAPKFNNGYTAPPGSVVYYPQHSALDYLPWVYLFSQDSPQNDQVTTVQPDGKEVVAQPVQEGVDGLAVFNWVMLIVIAVAILGGIVWGVNKFSNRDKTPKEKDKFGYGYY